MSELKAIGSEKLQGQDKLKRIMEIARYKENIPTSNNETNKSHFEKKLSDGKLYSIVKEKSGYVIKKNISEGQMEYIEPMKNRKYYPSYSQALKRLNIIAGEVSRMNGVDEQTSFFGEQKKYVLKTPQPSDDSDDEAPATPPPPVAPPTVPPPSLPASPEGEMPDMSDEPSSDEDENAPLPSEDGASNSEEEDIDDVDVETPTKGDDEGITFRMIQKLTGKLTQKIREFDSDKGLTSENMKYVINMVLSSMDLASLSEDDKEDIMMKFEGEEDNDMGDEMSDMGSEEMPNMGDEQNSEEVPVPTEPTEMKASIFDSIFGESKIDKVISRYFDITNNEKNFLKESQKEKNIRTKNILNSKMKKISMYTETIEQELASENFLKRNPSFVFVGKTNKNNLVFENKNEQIKISPKGQIL